MSRRAWRRIAAYAGELLLYGALVTAYLLLVLRFLEEPLRSLFDRHRVLYALAALGLIIGQGAALEVLTSALSRWTRGRR